MMPDAYTSIIRASAYNGFDKNVIRLVFELHNEI